MEGQRKQKCEHCGRTVSYKNYRRHIDRQHPGVPRRPITGAQLHCRACDRVFAQNQRSRHVKKYHEGAEPEAETIVLITDSSDESGDNESRLDEEPGNQNNTENRKKLENTPVGFKSRCTRAVERALDILGSLNSQEDHPAPRLAEELPLFVGLLRCAVEPDTIEFDPLLLDKITGSSVDYNARGYQVVFCSGLEAKLILDHGTLALPLLVPGDLNGRLPPQLKMETYLSFLASKDAVDVHQYDQDATEPSSDFLTPNSMTGIEAVKKFRSSSTLPVNLLNLDSYKPSPQPWFLTENDNLQIIRTITTDNIAGKRTHSIPSDLANSEAFQLCGKKGVFSMPHTDRHGVLTTIFCDDGEKLWLTWPHLSETELREWAASQQHCPNYQPMAIHLRPGDTLLLPSGTVHAPLSLTDVLMTGTMHWDSRNMRQVLVHSILESQCPSVTNEDTAADAVEKIRTVGRLWRDRLGPWQWGSDQDLEEFTKLQQEYDKEIVTCNCKTRCLVNSCPCYTLKKYCKPGTCHRGQNSVKCRNLAAKGSE